MLFWFQLSNMTLTSHAVVAAIELAFYILLLAPTLHNVVHFRLKEHTAWLFLTLFSSSTSFLDSRPYFARIFMVASRVQLPRYCGILNAETWEASRGLDRPLIYHTV